MQFFSNNFTINYSYVQKNAFADKDDIRSAKPFIYINNYLIFPMKPIQKVGNESS